MMRRRLSLDLPASLYFGALIGCAFLPESWNQEPAWAFFSFIPVGVFLLLLLGRRRWWAAIVFGALAATWIEAAQSVWMPAGYAQSTDVVWAVVGCALGVAITLAVVRSAQRPAHRPTQRPAQPLAQPPLAAPAQRRSPEAMPEPSRRGDREMLDSTN